MRLSKKVVEFDELHRVHSAVPWQKLGGEPFS